LVIANSEGPFVAQTAAIDAKIDIVKTDFAADRRRCTIFIGLSAPPASSSTAVAAAAATTTATTTPNQSTATAKTRYSDGLNIQKVALRLVDAILPAVAGDAARASARAAALTRVEAELYQFKNASYAAGFKSAKV